MSLLTFSVRINKKRVQVVAKMCSYWLDEKAERNETWTAIFKNVTIPKKCCSILNRESGDYYLL